MKSPEQRWADGVERTRRWRQAHPGYYKSWSDERRQQIRVAQNLAHARQMRVLRAFKAFVGCERCGYRRCLDAIELHHPDPSVKLGASAVRLGREDMWRTCLDCDVLCANCHREEHERLRKEAAHEVSPA